MQITFWKLLNLSFKYINYMFFDDFFGNTNFHENAKKKKGTHGGSILENSKTAINITINRRVFHLTKYSIFIHLFLFHFQSI